MNDDYTNYQTWEIIKKTTNNKEVNSKNKRGNKKCRMTSKVCFAIIYNFYRFYIVTAYNIK